MKYKKGIDILERALQNSGYSSLERTSFGTVSRHSLNDLIEKVANNEIGDISEHVKKTPIIPTYNKMLFKSVCENNELINAIINAENSSYTKISQLIQEDNKIIKNALSVENEPFNISEKPLSLKEGIFIKFIEAISENDPFRFQEQGIDLSDYSNTTTSIEENGKTIIFIERNKAKSLENFINISLKQDYDKFYNLLSNKNKEGSSKIIKFKR